MRVICSNPWIPVEWIKAHGLEPLGVWSLPENGDNGLPLSAGLCAFAETVVRRAENNPGDALVFSTACDQMRRSYDVAASRGRDRIFLFNLPATWQTLTAAGLFRSEIVRLGRFLESLGGRRPAAVELLETMKHYRHGRVELLRAAPHCPARRFAEAASRLYADGRIKISELLEQPAGQGVPIALIGGPLPWCHRGLFDAIEAAGGQVVLNGTEPGERTLGPVIPAGTAAADPVSMLSAHYFESITDVFQRPNSRLYDWLRPRLRSRKVRGIVLWHFIGCDLWRAEAQSLREAFALPVLPLDADELQGKSARETARIEAFVETLK